jgi:hypothetical protein
MYVNEGRLWLSWSQQARMISCSRMGVLDGISGRWP